MFIVQKSESKLIGLWEISIKFQMISFKSKFTDK